MSATPKPGSAGWRMTIRLAGHLIADGGRSHIEDVRDLAEDTGHTGALRRGDGSQRGLASTEMVRSAIRALSGLGLAERKGDAIIAVDLARLAAWVAGELREHPWGAAR